MTVKEEIAEDVESLFLNLDEFAEIHEVEGKKIECMLDQDSFRERTQGSQYGTGESGVTLHARTADLPVRRSALSVLNIDGREYTVLDWQTNMGMEVIDLVQGILA